MSFDPLRLITLVKHYYRRPRRRRYADIAEKNQSYVLLFNVTKPQPSVVPCIKL